MPGFTRHASALALAIAAGIAGAQSADAPEYLLTDDDFFSAPESWQLWDGFLTGLEGFDRFYEPTTNPIYFESPTIKTSIKAFYAYHAFPDGSALQGGNLDVIGLQVRLALTDKLAFIANKDGYTWFDPGIFPEEEEGWNDLSVGLKYNLYADVENDLLVTAGARYLWRSGSQDILQGTADELSPFISVGKGYGDLNLLGNATLRVGTDDDNSNDIFQWSLQADYHIANGIAPVVSLNGLHYLDNGNRNSLGVGGLDYSNLGSGGVAGNTVVSAGTGLAAKLTPQVEFGAMYEFALTDEDDDIMDYRFTVQFVFDF